MKVLLTGASGFVGSHVLDALAARGIPTVVLLRPTSNHRFIAPHLAMVEVRSGSITEPASLAAALRGITQVIHCAGLVKAVRAADLFAVNRDGTRNVVAAVNASRVQRLVHISSLAVSGPGTTAAPAREAAPPAPVSAYGRSKLAAEEEVLAHCRTAFTILRPAAVYGPRDGEFLRLFKAARAHVRPTFGGGRQELSLVFVSDLAAVILASLVHPGAPGRVFHVAAGETCTTRQLTTEIARQLGVRTFPLPLPNAMWWPICALAQAAARLVGRPTVLAHGKVRELTAPGWVADTGRLRAALALTCPTGLPAGIAATRAWYAQEGWL
jgi:nucleoside-diphosphate-sugar epimerase